MQAEVKSMRNILEKVNPIVFIILFASTFSYILFKVINVPITHDEVLTILTFTKLDVWEIMWSPETFPSNHVLNTLLTKISIFFFGKEQWAVRLPNLASFILYSIAVYRILNGVLTKQSIFFIPAALLFVSSPYVLDFFGLCRGYGISLALCTFSMSYLLSAFRTMNRKHIWVSLITAILASYASFTLLVFWAAITIMVLYFFIVEFKQKKRPILPMLLLVLINAGYLALIIYPIYHMQTVYQWEDWKSMGFIETTMKSLIVNSKYGSKVFLTVEFFIGFVFLILLINALFILLRSKKREQRREIVVSPITIATLTILLTAGINVLQTIFLDTPSLNGRAALFFFPLFMIVLVVSVRIYVHRIERKFKYGISIVLTVFLLHHVIHTAQPKSVREWSYDAHTLKVLQYIDEHRYGREITLNTHWMFNPSFLFYAPDYNWVTLGVYSKEIETTGADYYYLSKEDYPSVAKDFIPVLKMEDQYWLLKRRD